MQWNAFICRFIALFMLQAISLQALYSDGKPQQFNWTIDYNGEIKQVEMTLVDGLSPYELTKESCTMLSKEDCVRLMDTIHADFYGIIYTPTRPTSAIDDFHSNRVDILRYLQKRYDYKHYLEIGCQGNLAFSVMQELVDVAVGVDPLIGGTHRMTSDEFFSQNAQLFDLIFIDGMHESHYVWRDVLNSLRVLTPGGTIVLHDMNPRTKQRQRLPPPIDSSEAWNGDCWKVGVVLRLMEDVDLVIVDIDHGVGVLRVRPNSNPMTPYWQQRLVNNPTGKLSSNLIDDFTLSVVESVIDGFTYEEFDENRESLLKLVTLMEMRLWLEGMLN